MGRRPRNIQIELISMFPIVWAASFSFNIKKHSADDSQYMKVWELILVDQQFVGTLPFIRVTWVPECQRCYQKQSLGSLGSSYKNNYRSEGIRIANAQTKAIIFCKSHPLNWQLDLEDNNQQRNQASSTTMTTRLHDTSLKGASSIVETFHLLW